jgi:hypothetical protein
MGDVHIAFGKNMEADAVGICPPRASVINEMSDPNPCGHILVRVGNSFLKDECPATREQVAGHVLGQG